MILHSIRWRLQAWHGLLLVIVLTGFGLTAYQVARDNQLRHIDQELDQQLMGLFRPRPPQGPHGGSPGPGEHPRNHHAEGAEFIAKLAEAVQTAGAQETQTNGFYYVLWSPNRTFLAFSSGTPTNLPEPDSAKSASAALKGMPERERSHGPTPPHPPQARTRNGAREQFCFLPFGECVLVGRSLAPEQAAMHRLALWLMGGGASILLLGLVGGWWVASRAIRPIDQISGTAVKIAGGQLSQRIDVTDTDSELGRLAGVLNSTFARLEAAFAQQARFTADASHELRTPVAVILNQTQSVLTRDRNADEYREALEACQRAAQRMRKLTDTLLTLARLDAGEEPMKFEHCDLAQLTNECVELLKPLALERGVTLRTAVSRLECLGDSHQLSQVLLNLLTNAIQFNRPNGEVTVTGQIHNGMGALTVADTGVGISPEDLPHIFERFYRADKARSRVQGGTGLGLAISKAIVEAHGGSLSASSQLGNGAAFTLTFRAA